MRNVAVLFITQERLRAEIFIDIVRSSRGPESSVDSEDGFHLQDWNSSSPEESQSNKCFDLSSVLQGFVCVCVYVLVSQKELYFASNLKKLVPYRLKFK